MIRKRTFNLVSRTNASSWLSFDEAISNIESRKTEIEQTMQVAAFDHMFNEPMNVIVLECDEKHPCAKDIHSYAEKVNSIFADNDNKITIDVRLSNRPTRYKNRVYVEHTWFIREAI